MLNFTLKLTDPINLIEKKIMYALRDEINARFGRVVPIIRERVQGLTRYFFSESPEYDALINGPLDAHFGIPQGEAKRRVKSIVDVIIDNINVTFSRVSVTNGNKFRGGLSVYVLRSDFDDVISISDAVVISYKGEVFPWLQWLLFRGNEIIISGYEIDFGSYITSRSGKAIMVPNPIAVWRVPAQYAGDKDDNWLTRTVLDFGNLYANNVMLIIKEEIEKI